MAKRSGRTFRRRQHRQKSFQSAADCQQYNYFAFMKWLGRNGFKHSLKLRAHEFKETGRGLMTMSSIQSGATFVSIPEKLLISPDSVLGTSIGNIIRSVNEEMSGLEILTLFLICEKVKASASRWFPYISTLPDKYETPVLLESSLWKLLPPSIRQSYQEKMKDMKKSYLKIFKFINNLNLSKKDSYDLFIWAFFTVNTRAVYKECEHFNCKNHSCGFNLALAPYLDFLNHNWEAKVEAGFNKNNRCYEIVSHNSYKKYSQVFINYGSHSNRKLILEYGFLQAGNINDTVPIFLDDIQLAMKEIIWEYDILSDITLFHADLLNKMGIAVEGLTWSLETLLKVICGRDKNYKKEIILGVSNDYDYRKYQRLVKELLLLKLKEYSKMGLLKDSDYHSPICSTLYRLLFMEYNMLEKMSFCLTS